MARPRLAAAFVVLGLTLAAVPALADTRGQSKAQVDFGIKVGAERAVEGSPLPLEERGRDRSDLRRGVEQPGHRLRAQRAVRRSTKVAYEKALELEPKNVLIRQNYDLFKEINDRANRNGDR